MIHEEIETDHKIVGSWKRQLQRWSAVKWSEIWNKVKRFKFKGCLSQPKVQKFKMIALSAFAYQIIDERNKTLVTMTIPISSYIHHHLICVIKVNGQEYNKAVRDAELFIHALDPALPSFRGSNTHLS